MFQKEKPELVNTSFQQFCEEINFTPNITHRMSTHKMEQAYKSVAKYDTKDPPINENSWKLAVAYMERHFWPFMCKSSVLEKDIVLQQMDKTTSCGYPWSLKFQNKTEMLKSDSALVIDDYWDNIAQITDVIMPIWTNSQKIELRHVDKLAEDNVRTFTASPIEQSVACNRLCLDMNNKFYASQGKTWSKVGMSKFNQGWDILFRSLAKNKQGFALDGSRFDSTIMRRALWAVCVFRWKCLCKDDQTPENWTRLHHVYYAIINSLIVMEDGLLLIKMLGNPSGSSNTVVDNTLILFVYFAYAYIEMCKQNHMCPEYTDFMNWVQAALYGDDNSFTVNDKLIKDFNANSVATVWKTFGLIATTDDWEPRDVKDLDFLSNKFRYDDDLQLYLPVPDFDKTVSSLMYGAKHGVDNIIYHYLRACALRLDTWGNLKTRQFIWDYIEYLNVNYRYLMVGEIKLGKGIVKASDVCNQCFTDEEISELYSGRESSSYSLIFAKAALSLSIEIDPDYQIV